MVDVADNPTLARPISPSGADAENVLFPTGLAILTILLTGAALACAALEVRWSVLSAEPGAALQKAWLYVNLALGAVWFLVWPMTALRRRKVDPGAALGETQALAFAVIAASAIPCMGVASWLAHRSMASASPSLALQLAFGIFMFGLLHCRNGRAWCDALLAGLAAVLSLGLPLIAFLQISDARGASRVWFQAVPELALAGAEKMPISNGSWFVAGAFAAVGLGLWGLGTALLSP